MGGQPEHYKFGGGVSDSVLHPLVLIWMILAIGVIILSARRATLPVCLYSIFLIPAGQQFVVAGVHLFAIRIVIMAGLVKMLTGKPPSPGRTLAGGWNSLDTAVLAMACCHTVAFNLLYLNSSAFVNQCGYLWDVLGGYFLLRCAIRDHGDLLRAVKCLAILATIFAVCMLRERFTGENIFGRLGGVNLISEVRLGRVRAEAVFQHAILAGCFGATVLPLFVLLWKSGASRYLAGIAIVSAAIMTFTTACSTPLLAFCAGIGAICLWPVRKQMRLLRWSMVLALVGLSFAMKAPVWYLVAHVGVSAGSSADHRAELIDTFINHIGDWWLMGTDSNGSWGFLMFDTSNSYVSEGIAGGLSSLSFFILVICRSFGRVGAARKIVEGSDSIATWRFWLLGCSVFANVVAYFGISYFDQMKFAWFALLAMISAATSSVGHGFRTSPPEEVPKGDTEAWFHLAETSLASEGGR